jgi:hypothetical protein
MKTFILPTTQPERQQVLDEAKHEFICFGSVAILDPGQPEQQFIESGGSLSREEQFSYFAPLVLKATPGRNYETMRLQAWKSIANSLEECERKPSINAQPDQEAGLQQAYYAAAAKAIIGGL